MWKQRPDEKPASPSPSSQPLITTPSTPPVGGIKETRHPEPAKTSESFRTDVAAHIGKSVVVKGELSGSEDLYLDGEVEGTIELRDHSLVVGPNGRIRAHISAREVILHGKAEGNVIGSERVELKKSCVLVGDIRTQRVVIEDGAFFKGSVDLHKESKLDKESKPEPRRVMAASAAATPPAPPTLPTPASSTASATSASTPVLSPQTSFLEHE